MSRLGTEMTGLAKKAGGSHKTVHDRIQTVRSFSQQLKTMNIQLQRVAQIKVRHIESYTEARLAQGVAKRTLQNEMAALRSVLHQAGRPQVAEHERLTNHALGLSGASRSGTKQAISDMQYQNILQLAQQRDAGLACVIELARLMGLRSQEAVQCSQSLAGWQQRLAKGETRLPVMFGTKGGRDRQTVVLDREAVSRAVERALVIAGERNGRLIDRPDLKSAMGWFRREVWLLGLSGSVSPHSLRYAWAQEAMWHYLAQGFSKEETLAQTAIALGHGDGRGRYIRQVYGRGMEL